MTAFDTNILIYACDGADQERRTKALDLIVDTSDGVLLWQVACEFIAASRKLAAQGFAPDDAWKRVAEFISIFPLITPTPKVLVRAQDLHLKSGWSSWDAMVVGACLECGATRLYSEALLWPRPDGTRNRQSVSSITTSSRRLRTQALISFIPPGNAGKIPAYFANGLSFSMGGSSGLVGSMLYCRICGHAPTSGTSPSCVTMVAGRGRSAGQPLS
jgi:predicted nucleic acid-binding protein